MMPYDEEESESSDENLKYRALPVADLPKDFDPTKPPTSAEEYLHHVMWEARQCDEVVTVKIDKSRIKKPSAVVRPNIKEVSPKAYLPDPATQQTILEQFFKTKSQVDNLRKSKNKPNPPVKLPTSENPDHWCRFCFGNAFQRSILLKQQQARKDAAKDGASLPSSSLSAAASGSTAAESSTPSSKDATGQPDLPEAVEGQPPLLSILLNIKQATLQNLMEWHVGWLEVAGFSEHQGKWLYSLLACLEKPLIPELCDNVRQMVFLCARARARLDSEKHPFLPQLNLIITIVTRYFNQEDLADPR